MIFRCYLPSITSHLFTMKNNVCLQNRHHLLPYLLFLLLCFSVGALHAQNKKIDSLNQLIASEKTDTGRVRLTNKKIALISQQNLDSGIFYGLRNIAEAHRLRYYEGELDARNKLATNYCYKGNYTVAADELTHLLAFVKPSKDSLDLAGVYANFGMLYGMQNKYDTSIVFYKKAMRIKERNRDSATLGSTYSNISIGYQQQGDFVTALQYQQKAVRLAELRHNESSEAYALLNMAITYEEIEDTAKAQATYVKAAGIASRLHLPLVEMYANSNIAALYLNGKHDWKSGYDYAMKAAAQAKQIGDVGMQATNIGKASLSLSELGDYKQAYQLAKEAITMSALSTQPSSIAQAQEAMGHLFFVQKKWAEAIPFYERKFSVPGTEYNVNTIQTYTEVSTCYEKTGNYAKALSTYKMASQITDSLRRKDNIRKATELSMNYNFEKKQEVQAAEKKKEDEIVRTKQVSLLVGLLLVLLGGVIAFIGYRNKQKANRVLVRQKKQIETTLTELKTTQQQLIQSEKMASLGELTAGIAHEIQNPLNFVNNFSEVSSELMEELTEELRRGDIDEAKAIGNDIRQNLEKINHHGRRADAIVKGMLQHSRTTKGVKEPTDINALCDEYVRLSYHGLRAKDKSFNADFSTHFDDTIGNINIIPQDMGRVLLNLLTNAFYAVNEKKKTGDEAYKPKVSIATKNLGEQVEIVVTDNGNGIPEGIQNKIFQPFFTTKPTGEGTGLGLSLSYDIITKEHNGTISVESKEGDHSFFRIVIPRS